MDNGMGYSAYIKMENGDQAGRGTKINVSDALTFSIENDGSVGIEGAAKALLPYVNNRRQDIAGFSRSAAASSPFGTDIGDNTSGDNALGLTFKSGVGSFMYSYTPNPDSTGSTDDLDGATTNTGASSSFGFKGNLGIDGLTVGLGSYTQEASDPALADGKSKAYGFNYKIGSFAVGAQSSKNEMVGDAVASQEVQETQEVGVAYSINDAFTVGAYIAKVENENIGAVALDQDVTVFQAGYNLGPASLQYDYADTNNAYNTANRDLPWRISTESWK